jgi:hypothetical protein
MSGNQVRPTNGNVLTDSWLTRAVVLERLSKSYSQLDSVSDRQSLCGSGCNSGA